MAKEEGGLILPRSPSAAQRSAVLFPSWRLADPRCLFCDADFQGLARKSQDTRTLWALSHHQGGGCPKPRYTLDCVEEGTGRREG